MGGAVRCQKAPVSNKNCRLFLFAAGWHWFWSRKALYYNPLWPKLCSSSLICTHFYLSSGINHWLVLSICIYFWFWWFNLLSYVVSTAGFWRFLSRLNQLLVLRDILLSIYFCVFFLVVFTSDSCDAVTLVLLCAICFMLAISDANSSFIKCKPALHFDFFRSLDSVGGV